MRVASSEGVPVVQAASAAPAAATARVRSAGSTWLPVGVGVLSVALTVAAVGLAAWNGLTFGRALTEFLVARSIAGVAFTAVGMLVLARRPGHRVGWLFLLAGFGLPQFLTQYARFAVVTRPGAAPAGELAAWLSLWVWLPFLVVLVIFLPLLFPDGRLPSRLARAVASLAVVGTVAGIAHRALSPGADPALPEIANPYAVSGAEGALTALGAVAIVALLTSLLGAFVSLLVRFRHSAGDERLQLKWFVFATAVIVAAELVSPAVTFLALGATPAAVSPVAEAVMAPWLAVAAGVAILRHRLYDIDLLINRTLVYGALTVALIGGYVLVVGYFRVMLDLRGEPVSLLAAAVVAVVFAPLRTRLQQIANRLVYGRRDEPYAALSELGKRLDATLEPDAVLPTVVATVRDALKLRHAEIVLASDGRRVSDGEPAETPLRLPLLFGPAQVGELLVSPRAPGETFSAADRRLLDDFARQAAVAAHAVALSRDVHRARTRLVTAREEERRRLRRDLHDGLGPQLASQTLALDAARSLIRTDPAAAADLLTELREQTRDAVAGIRRLVYDLRPPVLDDRGLLAALAEQAARYRRDGLRVDLDLPAALPPLPAAVDVAVYRIALEALTNVVRHASAARCTVALRLEPGWIVLEVRDDGRGLPPDHAPGVGMGSMRERAAELGGTAIVGAGPGRGTVVTARLPLVEER